MKLIQRNNYIKKIRPYYGKNIIKVLTGQRRCGKSYLMQLLQEDIKTREPLSHLIYINKEKLAFDAVQNYKDLYAFVREHTVDGRKNIVMIDEIQEIESFEKAIRDLNEDDRYDVYCTGSNARLLSGELATLLAGRYIQINVHSLSYNEFLCFHSLSSSMDALKRYLQFGGMPYLIHFNFETDVVFGYLKTLRDSIVLKDVVGPGRLRDLHLLERLLLFLADNTGSLLTAANISAYLKSEKIGLSVNTVMNYIKALENAFIIHRVSRYDIAGKKRFEINDKYYFEDIGIRNAIMGFRQADIGKLMENVIHKHLQINGYTAHVGKFKTREIDFVAKKADETVYIQSAYLLPTKETREREFGNLLKIPDNHRKMVVSMDEFAKGNQDGIEHVHILDFLSTFD